MRLLILLPLFLITICGYCKTDVRIETQPVWLIPFNLDANRKIDLKKVSSGYYLELFDEQVNLSENLTYTHFTRNIVNEKGIQDVSEVSVEFDPEYQSVVFHFVRIIRDGKVISDIKKGDIRVIQQENESDEYIYDGMKKAFIILKDVRKNDKIDVAYSVSGFNPVFRNKFIQHIYFNNNTPILNYFQSIISPVSRDLKIALFGNASAPQVEVKDNIKIYRWSNPEIKLWEAIGSTPSWYNVYPYVTVTEYRHWKEVVDWGIEIYNHYHHDLPASLKEKIERWKIQAAGDNDEFARLALRFVQDEIRYLGLETGINTHQPRSPAAVVGNGFGDCKEKALLYSSILRTQNIPAYAALVHTSKTREMINVAPSPGEFNHVIVAIEKQGRFIYLDPTLSYQRGDLYNISVPDYRYALLVKPGETALRSIDPSGNHVTRIFERLKVKFNDTSVLEVNTSYRGSRADNLRSYIAGSSISDIAEGYENYYSSLFDGIKLQEDVVFEDDSVNNVINAKEKYSIPEIWSYADSPVLQFSTYAKAIAQALVDPSGASKKHPLSLSFPTEVHYTLDLEMPETWSFPQEALHIKNDAYEFTFNVEPNGKLITLKYSLKTFQDFIAAEQVEQYKKDYKKISEVLQYNLTYGNAVGGNSTPSLDGINWILVMYGVVLISLAAIAFYYLNYRIESVDYDRTSGWHLGSWMYLLGFSLLAGFVVSGISLIENEYYSISSYNAWKKYGILFLATVLFEFTLNLYWMCATAALLYWFANRRDIFPKTFIWCVGILLVSKLCLVALYNVHSSYPEFKGPINENLKSFFQTVVYAAIWCTYISRSYRAKATFLKGYNRNIQ